MFAIAVLTHWRRIIGLTLGIVFFTIHPPISAAQEDTEPFMVYVDQEGVTARCGPGGDYYRTDPLRHGQALEVYVETADGWLGIRPPEGSFCWLPADVLKLSPSQDFGVVNEDNALAWIGTHLGKANKYLWQVQLSKGEEVAILGRAKREGPDGMKLWFRIVPPAGEFRWVHRDQVVDSPEMLLRDKPKPGSRYADGQPTLAPIVAEEDDVELVDNEPIEKSVMLAERTLSLPKPQPDLTSPIVSEPQQPAVVGSGVKRDSNAFVSANDKEIVRAYEAPLVAFTTRPSVRSIGQSDAAPLPAAENLADVFDRRAVSRDAAAANTNAFVDDSRVKMQPAIMPVSNIAPATSMNGKDLDALQLELSRLMSRSAPATEVEPVLSASSAHVRSATTETDRQRAAMIVQRAQQYQQVARRRDGGSTSSAALIPSSVSYPEPILPAASIVETQPAHAAPEMSGYLVQVFSSRPDSPPFALTDSQGRTTFYVSAAPGVNLRRYLNQYISVRGAAGYTTGLDTPHVIASGAVRSLER